ncbi:hypothetical protein [Janthinobacterium sp. MDB2-8]|uniref:hypothetical protein n=1 Tax=Janthinobacterium sp. MDB2-8 TaxID=1259338 RepID=UPI003F286C11
MADMPSAEPAAGDFFVLAVLMMSPFVCLPVHYGTAKRGAFAPDQDWQAVQKKSGRRKKDSRSCLLDLQAVARKQGITWRRLP